jgi:hypothetical protein
MTQYFVVVSFASVNDGNESDRTRPAISTKDPEPTTAKSPPPPSFTTPVDENYGPLRNYSTRGESLSPLK